MKIIKFIVIVCFILMSAEVLQAQSTITFVKGNRTFTAQSSASTFQWYLNGILQPSFTSSTFNNNWDTGKYWLAAAAVSGGCSGDTFSIILHVVDSIVNGVKVEWASISPVTICPPQDGSSTGNVISVGVNLVNYTLNGETYTIVYTIDDGVPINQILNSENNALFDINAKNLPVGIHAVKIIRLIYGPGGIYIKDYNSGIDAPTIMLDVKSLPVIEDIKYNTK